MTVQMRSVCFLVVSFWGDNLSRIGIAERHQRPLLHIFQHAVRSNSFFHFLKTDDISQSGANQGSFMLHFVTSAVVVDGLLYIQMRCHCNEVVSQSGPKPVFRSIRRRWAGHWDNWSQLFGRRRLCQILLHLFKSAQSRPGSPTLSWNKATLGV